MALIHWIKRNPPGRLGVMARPRRGRSMAEDLRALKKERVDVLVSFLDDEEIAEFRLQGEQAVAKQVGMVFKRFPIADRSTPAVEPRTIEFLNELYDDLQKGRNVALHCSSGRGRTGVIAASLLVMDGFDAESAMKHVRGHRLTPIPDTSEQMEWVRAFAEHLGRTDNSKPERNPKMAVAAAGVALLGFGLVFALRKR